MKPTKRKRKLIDQKQVSLKSKNSRHHETKYLKGKPAGQSVPSKFFGKHETQVSEHGEVNLHKHVISCKKNPGHTKFIPIESFCLNHLPKYYRDAELYDLIKVVAELAVRVEVKVTSPRRVEFWPDSDAPYPFYNSVSTKSSRYGSGELMNVIKWAEGAGYDVIGDRYESDSMDCPCCKCQDCGQPSRVWWEFTVLTATHVVFDDVEADQTVCRLFYDTQSSPGTILDHGRIYRSSIREDVCVLSFTTCDNHDLGNLLFGNVENWFKLWQKLQEKFERSRFTFIVSHPHGCPKQVSFGQWVHNYVVDRSSDQRDMSKLTYTTCTCPGSSGAGVFCVGFGEHVHSGSFDTKLNVSGFGFSNWN
ncbi:uncharacterized protein LOC106076322 isoform X2 [Biomphalaria glabrata]|nr:uncharacterized protein LOC106076322 isoform X2 [Biomphalaria glabrata]XP_055896469.1 uncharacterized protein LOC106076322 isoform X2 [Biomphalaria glabrata]XP_055896470.1 uncharacterized protein LOC106076322 isoform X2 [Biomphalaria glabrata]